MAEPKNPPPAPTSTATVQPGAIHLETEGEGFDAVTYAVDEHGHTLFPLTDLQLAQLKADLNEQRVSSRSQGGSNLSYLEAYDVKAMLTKIFGFGGWSAEVLTDGTKLLKMEEIMVPDFDWVNEGGRNKKVPKVDKDGNTVLKPQWRSVAQATMQLHIHQLGATYAETAISSQNGIDPGEVSDFAIKTAESDALKRCAINLGTTFGLSLYNKGSLFDVVGPVLAPGQRKIEQDLAALRRRTEQPQIEAEIKTLAEALSMPALTPPAAGDEDTAHVAGGARQPEEAPEGIDTEAKETAAATIASGFSGGATKP